MNKLGLRDVKTPTQYHTVICGTPRTKSLFLSLEFYLLPQKFNTLWA